MRRIVSYAMGILLLQCGSSHALDEQQLIDDFRAKLAVHLSTVGAAPLYGASYHVGDVWDITMTHLIERDGSCFPKLAIRTNSASIAAVSLKQAVSVGLAFRLKQLFNLAGTGDQKANVTMYFDDVTEEIASQGDFRSAFDRKACRDEANAIDGKPLAADEIPNVIIGRILRGKRRVVLAYDDAASVSAAAEKLTAAALPIPVSIEASAQVNAGKIISLVDKESVPIAYAPVVVPVRASGTSQGGPTGENDVQYQWVPFSLEQFPSEKQSLSELAGASGWKWAD